jgi:putative transposase
MNSEIMISPSNVAYSLRLQIVLVTKYRRPILTPELLEALQAALADILLDWRCQLVEFSGASDHVSLLVSIHPAIHLSTLINNLKSASARRMRNQFAEHLGKFYSTPAFWHRAYYVATIGQPSRDMVTHYVQAQGTQEKPRRTRSHPRSDK